MHPLIIIVSLHAASNVLAMPNPVAEPNALALPHALPMIEEIDGSDKHKKHKQKQNEEDIGDEEEQKSTKHKHKQHDDHDDDDSKKDSVSDEDFSFHLPKCPTSTLNLAGWCGGCRRLETCLGTLGFLTASCLFGSVTIGGVLSCFGSVGFATGEWNYCVDGVSMDLSDATQMRYVGVQGMVRQRFP
ncbi:hypothetical protein HII31_03919 [Pseudocercospora fuligena]|uniref:Transmembrane protein n=1 Tax=Pseudocercospora fuligena TaxID=685502 RepID=A0A8H6RP85_9PEZI|nr:hypothetical protein HII31_03919 [Pseudocercospora fuligena]